MEVMSYTRARQSFANLMKTVNADHTTVHVTQKSGDDVVVMSKSDFDALEETLHLLSSPVNAARLNESISELEAGKGTEHALRDV